MDGPYFCVRACCCGFVASACSPEAASAAFVGHLTATLADEHVHQMVTASSGPALVPKQAPVREPTNEE